MYLHHLLLVVPICHACDVPCCSPFMIWACRIKPLLSRAPPSAHESIQTQLSIYIHSSTSSESVLVSLLGFFVSKHVGEYFAIHRVSCGLGGDFLETRECIPRRILGTFELSGLKKPSLGTGHPALATRLTNPAELWARIPEYIWRHHTNLALPFAVTFQAKYDEAKALCVRSLAMYEKVYGPDHPAVATGLNNWAGVLKRQARVNIIFEYSSICFRVYSFWRIAF